MNPSALRIVSRSGALAPILVLVTLLLPRPVLAEGEQRFATPEDAVKALTTAAQARDTNAMHALFGPAAHDLVSPDIVEATTEFQVFVERLTQKTQLARDTDSRITLQLGPDGWPFPIPLVKQDDQWFFDTAAGKDEILSRRIGMNELDTIGVCHAYVSAQREYASMDRLGDGVLQYAQLLRSSPGAHDGLYWSQKSGDELSPLGPLIAQARVQGYRHATKIMTDDQSPYHGYYFKILTRQGKYAPGGKYSYVINGRMIAGFALVAWPAEWGNTGMMTFIVNQQGRVYQKNLGPRTSKIAAGLSTYNPDSSWALVDTN